MCSVLSASESDRIHCIRTPPCATASSCIHLLRSLSRRPTVVEMISLAAVLMSPRPLLPVARLETSFRTTHQLTSLSVSGWTTITILAPLHHGHNRFRQATRSGKQTALKDGSTMTRRGYYLHSALAYVVPPDVEHVLPRLLPVHTKPRFGPETL